MMSQFPPLHFQITSTTGCSSVGLAENLQNTQKYRKLISVKTIHSWSGIRMCKGDESRIIQSILANRFAVNNWKKVSILIIDEVSMLSYKMMNVLEKVARIIRKNPAPFGGIQVIFLGDMFQLAPIQDDEIPSGTPSSAAAPPTFCFESPVWKYVFAKENHIELKTIYRQNDDVFKNILNEIRVGQLSDANKEILKQYVGRPLPTHVIPTKILSTRSKVNTTNANEYANIEEKEYCYECVVTTNITEFVDTHTPLTGEERARCAAMTPAQREHEIQTMKASMPCPEVLRLKRGCPVICLVNLNVEGGICNGSLGKVVNFDPVSNHPIILFRNGQTMTIERYSWQNSDYPSICVSQYPLALSFANTIHKLQGASLDMALMDLGHSIFTEGQIYVALSRIRSLDGLYLQAFHPGKIKVNPKVVEFYRSFQPVEEDTKADDGEEEQKQAYE